MRRRDFITLLGAVATWPLAARAQQAAMPVIGFLNPQSPDAYAEPLRGLHQGLKDTGYVEGENLAIEYRWGDNQIERLPALAADLADGTGSQSTVREMEAVGRAMGLRIQVFNADTGREIEAAFESIGRERPDALFVAPTPFMVARRVQLVQRAAYHRIPASYALRDFAEAGGLMSYGASLRDAYRQVGAYAGLILKGAKPAELPVVQSTKFELVINYPTARMLGLTVPPNLLATADEVIE
jgi:ABC-type uncharacterized transport system substrate-binding protein